MNKPLPKSLHTVTVLVRMARLIEQYEPNIPWSEAVATVLIEMGLNDKPDTYGLKQAALKQLEN